jgi:hypothetical protein
MFDDIRGLNEKQAEIEANKIAKELTPLIKKYLVR